MLAAIQFDNQVRLQAHEIQNIVPEGMLPPKFKAAHLTSTQMTLQSLFRIGHIVAQRALQFVFMDLFVGLAFHDKNPIPSLTLPLKGRVKFPRTWKT